MLRGGELAWPLGAPLRGRVRTTGLLVARAARPGHPTRRRRRGGGGVPRVATAPDWLWPAPHSRDAALASIARVQVGRGAASVAVGERGACGRGEGLAQGYCVGGGAEAG